MENYLTSKQNLTGYRALTLTSYTRTTKYKQLLYIASFHRRLITNKHKQVLQHLYNTMRRAVSYVTSMKLFAERF